MGEHALDGQRVMDDRVCGGCGYSLRGLAVGGGCPECGRGIAGTRAAGRFLDDLSRAPMWYLRTLFVGLGVCVAALVWAGVLASVAAAQGVRTVAWMAAGGAAAVLWAAGVWVVTVRRGTSEQTAPDALLDSDRLRLAARAGAFVPLSVVALAGLASMALGAAAGAAVPGAPAPVSSIAGMLIAVAGVGALLGLFALVPLGAYLSALADWAGEEGVAGRLRGACWSLAVCGSLGVGFAAVSVLPVGASGLASLLLMWMLGAVGLATAVVLLSVVQLWHSVWWARRNRAFSEGSFERVMARKAARFDADGADEAEHPLCAGCGYDLWGIGPAGNCPECGASFEVAGAFVLPPRARGAEAEVALELAEGGGEVRHTPRAISAERRGLEWQEDVPLAEGGGGSIRHTPRSIGAERRGRREEPELPGGGEAGI